jgi:predicted outer membrane repeat protein
LQSAIDAAQSGDQVWVAAGTYLPTKDPFGSTSPTDNRDKTFYLKNGVKYYGGFAGNETALTERNHRSNQTILSGNLTNDQNANNDAYHVVLAVSASSSTELNGFVIREGRASANTTITVSGNAIERNYGAGLHAESCSLTIANCTFASNNANSLGGGAYLRNGNPSISSCVFSTNNSSSAGGGLYVQDGSGTLNNCLFVSNSANNDGGGLCTTDFVATVLNCTFNFNSSDTNGGAIASRGGDFASSITVRNTIIWGNAGSGVLGLYTTTSPLSTPTVTYSDIQGSGVFAGTGNINADPLFVSTSDRDGADNIFGTPDDGLRLASSSPAVNTGNNTGVSTTDLTGGVRLVGSTVDMGAYERCDLTPTATSTTPVLCVGQSISLSATGGTSYSWAGPSGSGYSSNSQNPTAFAATSTSFNGVYSVTVSSSAVGCSVSVTTSVYVNTTLRVSASTVNYPIVCVGQNISLQATESWPSYSWQGPAGSGYTSNAQNPATFSPTSTAFNGGYTVTATFGTCTGSASVSVQVLPTIEASVSPTTVSVGQSVQLSVTNPANAWFLYGWRGPTGSGYSSTSQNPSAFVASSTAFSGIFSVTAVGGDCSATATATVSLAVATNRPFITRWDLSKTGSGTNNQLSFGVGTAGTVSYTWQEVGGTNASGSGTFTGSTATITGLPTNGTRQFSTN